MKRAQVMTARMLLAALCTFAGARTAGAAPPPADPPPVVEGDTTTATMQGMQIIVKRVPGADFVSGNLYVKGGARNWSHDNAVVEALALAVSAAGGSEKLAKDPFARKLAHLGSTITAETREEYSVVRVKSLQPAWDETFALAVDAFLRPALPASEIEVQRQRFLSQLKHEEDDPDGRLAVLAHELMFHNHPFANRAIGTQLTMAKLDAAQLRAHLAKLRETKRLLLIVVGDVDAGHVLTAARQAFGALPRGLYRDQPLAAPAPSAPKLEAVERKLPTNYIVGHFVGPAWNDAGFAAGLVGMTALAYRELVEVRTKRNLSYAPAARFTVNQGYPLGTLYVTAVDPKTTWTVMLDEARKLGAQPIGDAELTGTKSTFLTSFLMTNETTTGQADFLGDCQLFAGDWRAVRKLPEKIRAVTSADVQSFAQKYLHTLQTTYLGDPAKLDKKLFESL
jgi:predicted Zn-dependent peptidase